MQLSPHFTLAELTVTDTGLDNTPTQEEIHRLSALAQHLEHIRILLGGRPITINSAFRSEQVNEAVGGVPTSAHRLCYAADFSCPYFGKPYDIAAKLARTPNLQYDQLIHEEAVWVHISFDPRFRMQKLTTYDGENYEDGISP